MLKVHEITEEKMTESLDINLSNGVKCVTFAGPASESSICMGSFQGEVSIFDLNHQKTSWSQATAHDSIVNAIDGCGGTFPAQGQTEIVSCSRDGKVKVWDPRVSEPIVILEPSGNGTDCWTVAFGDAHSESERCIVAGYSNGDVKMLDLKSMQIKWETNLGNGVCHLSFDRKDIPMNKLHAACLEGQLCVFDMRTYNPQSGFTSLARTMGKSTVWGCHPSPHDRDIVAVSSGNGSVSLLKYSYPITRSTQDADGLPLGVTGSWENLVETVTVSTQPIVSLDWHPERKGLVALTSFDQEVRIAFVTGLD